MSQILVRLKKDPSKVRLMTERSFQANRNKWELAEETSIDDKSDIAIALAKSKKKPVAPAGGVTADSDHRIEITKEEFQLQREAIREEISGGLIDRTEFVNVSELSTDDTEKTFTTALETLREAYELQSGKPADKRWKENKIKSEIEKLTTK